MCDSSTRRYGKAIARVESKNIIEMFPATKIKIMVNTAAAAATYDLNGFRDRLTSHWSTNETLDKPEVGRF